MTSRASPSQSHQLPSQDLTLVETSTTRLLAWLEGNGLSGFDCYDGTLSPLSPPLARLDPLLTRLLVQANRRSPISLRGLFSVPESVSAKSIAMVATGLLHLHVARGDPALLQRALELLRWLQELTLPGYSGACWGYPFDVYVRSFKYLRGTPTLVASCFCAQAFIEAWRITGQDEHLAIARSTADFILRDLPTIPLGEHISLPYHPSATAPVHNANMLGVGLLAQIWGATSEHAFLDLGRRALDGTMSLQREDGSWPYGEEKKLSWIDSFHTGFNLESLWRWLEHTGETRHEAAFQKGLAFYARNFFEADGTPRYTPTSLLPIDIRCSSQGIQTFTLLSGRSALGGDLERARLLARWAITHMQDASGYFYYQKHRHYTLRTPYLRWSQGPMLVALALLLRAESGLSKDKEPHR